MSLVPLRYGKNSPLRASGRSLLWLKREGMSDSDATHIAAPSFSPLSAISGAVREVFAYTGVVKGDVVSYVVENGPQLIPVPSSTLCGCVEGQTLVALFQKRPHHHNPVIASPFSSSSASRSGQAASAEAVLLPQNRWKPLVEQFGSCSAQLPTFPRETSVRRHHHHVDAVNLAQKKRLRGDNADPASAPISNIFAREKANVNLSRGPILSSRRCQQAAVERLRNLWAAASPATPATPPAATNSSGVVILPREVSHDVDRSFAIGLSMLLQTARAEFDAFLFATVASIEGAATTDSMRATCKSELNSLELAITSAAEALAHNDKLYQAHHKGKAAAAATNSTSPARFSQCRRDVLRSTCEHAFWYLSDVLEKFRRASRTVSQNQIEQQQQQQQQLLRQKSLPTAVSDPLLSFESSIRRRDGRSVQERLLVQLLRTHVRGTRLILAQEEQNRSLIARECAISMAEGGIAHHARKAKMFGPARNRTEQQRQQFPPSFSSSSVPAGAPTAIAATTTATVTTTVAALEKEEVCLSLSATASGDATMSTLPLLQLILEELALAASVQDESVGSAGVRAESEPASGEVTVRRERALVQKKMRSTINNKRLLQQQKQNQKQQSESGMSNSSMTEKRPRKQVDAVGATAAAARAPKEIADESAARVAAAEAAVAQNANFEDEKRSKDENRDGAEAAAAAVMVSPKTKAEKEAAAAGQNKEKEKQQQQVEEDDDKINTRASPTRRAGRARPVPLEQILSSFARLTPRDAMADFGVSTAMARDYFGHHAGGGGGGGGAVCNDPFAIGAASPTPRAGFDDEGPPPHPSTSYGFSDASFHHSSTSIAATQHSGSASFRSSAVVSLNEQQQQQQQEQQRKQQPGTGARGGGKQKPASIHTDASPLVKLVTPREISDSYSATEWQRAGFTDADLMATMLQLQEAGAVIEEGDAVEGMSHGPMFLRVPIAANYEDVFDMNGGAAAPSSPWTLQQLFTTPRNAAARPMMPTPRATASEHPHHHMNYNNNNNPQHHHYPATGNGADHASPPAAGRRRSGAGDLEAENSALRVQLIAMRRQLQEQHQLHS